MSDAEVRDVIGVQVDEFVKRVAYEASSLDLLGLRARVMGLLGPDPAGFDPLIEEYSRMAFQTGADAFWGDAGDPSPGMVPTSHRVARSVADARGLIADWTGDAAYAFTDGFAGAFLSDGTAVIQQCRAITSLQLATGAHRAIYARVRTDVKALFEAADTALDSFEEFSSENIPVVLNVIAAIATVAAAASGVGWVIVTAAGSTLSGVVATQLAQPKDRVFDPSSRYAIACRLFELVAELESDVAEAESQVRDAVATLTTAMNVAGGGRSELVGPAVADPQGQYPMTYTDDGTGALPGSYTDAFVPPSATE